MFVAFPARDITLNGMIAEPYRKARDSYKISRFPDGMIGLLSSGYSIMFSFLHEFNSFTT